MKKRLRSSAGPDELTSIAPEPKRKKVDKPAKVQPKAEDLSKADDEDGDSYDSEVERLKVEEQLRLEILEHLRKKDEPLTLQ